MTDAGADPPFLSIGEVLDLLKADFPDVTISKIRFLESQGLVDPERTPSGYRKFYDDDVERLRWILRQQREHFLPLKVIKERIEAEGGATPGDGDELPTGEPAGGPAGDDAGPAAAGTTAPTGSRAGGDVGGDVLTSGLSAATFTREELSRASGCDAAALSDLERYGLLRARSMDGASYFDEESLIVARLAAGFARHGVEARHLRMYKTAAEREAGFFEQVVMPMAMQRNPVARQESRRVLSDLVRLGEALRASMLRQALRPGADGS